MRKPRFADLESFRRDRRLAGTGQHAVERVVILGRDRIELMVVASGAGDRQAHEAPADDVDPIVNHVMDIAHEPAAEREKPERRERSLALFWGKPVGRDLLDQESVVGQVTIKRIDDIVAIGVGPVKISVLEQNIALGIGIPGDVEPVSPPSLAIAR